MPDGSLKQVAVKVLRPGIEQRFQKDLDSYVFAARMIERFHPPSRRLRPIAVVDTLAKSVAIEMDLRMEAAAISEIAENTKNDEGFRVPTVDWTRSARRVLTLEWIDGIPIADRDALAAAGHDVKALGAQLMQTFLRHAMRDGFFHADMHPGNLFIDEQGRIVAVDFGIMGRLGMKERRFLAEILYGFLNRNYTRVAEVHFEAGYVPRKHSVAQFAQALRAIGEPIMDRPASEISMAQLLGQLLQYTEVFDMQTRPELLLLQKTMVVVEGVGRSLDPELNMWVVSEPVVKEWMEQVLGPGAQIRGRGRRRGERRPLHGRYSEIARPGRAHGRGLVLHGRGGLAARRSYGRAAGGGARPREPRQAASASGSARWRSRQSRLRCCFECRSLTLMPVMAGLVPAIHDFIYSLSRGCPA